MTLPIRRVSAILVLVFLTHINIAVADLTNDANRIFDWAEQNYPQFFRPSGAGTESRDPWLYRYYPETNTYAGVNTDNEVWVLGDMFGGLSYVTTVNELLNVIDPQTVCSSENMTLENYDAIQVGMTVDQVNQIIGCSHLPEDHPEETGPRQSIYSYHWVSEESYQWINVIIDYYDKKVVAYPSFKTKGGTPFSK